MYQPYEFFLFGISSDKSYYIRKEEETSKDPKINKTEPICQWEEAPAVS